MKLYNHTILNYTYNASSQSAQKTYTALLTAGKKYRVSFDFIIDGITKATYTVINGSNTVGTKLQNVTNHEVTEFTATNTNLTLVIELSAGNYGRLAHIDNLEIAEIAEVGESYRFGFNGMEKDDEMKGEGNSYDFGARIYDSRLGRWLSLDPMSKSYPDYTPYNYSLNSPLMYGDDNGEWVGVKTTKYKMVNGEKVQLKGMKSIFVKADIIEKQVEVHQVKLLDLTGAMKDKEKTDAAEHIQSDIELRWNSANNKDEPVDENGYVTNSRGQKIKMIVTFAEPITVVQSKNEIQRGDNVVAVVNSNDERLSGAAALVSGGVMYYDKEYLDIKYPTIPAHEYGHWMGHLDSWMRLSRDKREIMYNKKDALQNNYPVPYEFKRSRSNPGLTAPKSKDLRPSKSKKDE